MHGVTVAGTEEATVAVAETVVVGTEEATAQTSWTPRATVIPTSRIYRRPELPTRLADDEREAKPIQTT